MAGSYFPGKDNELDGWFKNFVQVAGQHETELGIGPSDITAISALTQNFDASISQMYSAFAAYKAASNAKMNAKKNAEKLIRTYVKRFQASPSISNATRALLQIPVYKKPTGPVLPVAPDNLLATPNASGINNLRWKPNGNRQGVMYVVQAKPVGTGDWQNVGVSTRASYAHKGVTPGVPMRYRVAAQRADKLSGMSNEAGVYGG